MGALLSGCLTQVRLTGYTSMEAVRFGDQESEK